MEYLMQRMLFATRKRMALTVLVSIGILVVLGITGLYQVNKFFDRHVIKFESPIRFQKPIWIEGRSQAKAQNSGLSRVVAAEPVQTPAPAQNIQERLILPPKKGVLPAAPGVKKPATKAVFMDEPQIRAYSCPKFGKDCETFIAVLIAENGTHECTRRSDLRSDDGGYDWGLAQIHVAPGIKYPYTIAQLQDCKFNLDVAYQKYQARGFSPWTAYTSGRYKKFLNS